VLLDETVFKLPQEDGGFLLIKHGYSYELTFAEVISISKEEHSANPIILTADDLENIVKIKEDISQKHSYDLFQLSMCQMYRKFDFDNVIYCLLNKTAPMLEISSGEMDCLLATSIMLKGNEKEVIQSINNLAEIITDFYGPYRGHFIDVKNLCLLWAPLQDDIRLMEIVEYLHTYQTNFLNKILNF
jgi:hypothetical protein